MLADRALAWNPHTTDSVHEASQPTVAVESKQAMIGAARKLDEIDYLDAARALVGDAGSSDSPPRSSWR